VRAVTDGITYGTLGAGKGIGKNLPRARTLGRFLELKDTPGVGEYGIFKGHHLHAKKAFEGIVDENRMVSFSQKFLDANKLSRPRVTGFQNAAYSALKKAGITPTLRDHTRIAVEALVKAGYDPVKARQAVAISLRRLRDLGVKNYTGTKHPWTP